MLEAIFSLTRAEAVKRLQASDMPVMLKAAICGGLAMMRDPDYNRYRGLIVEAIGTLNETERGRAVLAEVGLLDAIATN